MTPPTNSPASDHHTRPHRPFKRRTTLTYRLSGKGGAEQSRDHGAAPVAAMLVLAAGALLLILILLTASLLGTDSTSSCGAPASLDQPAITSRATMEIPDAYLDLYRKAGTQYGLPWNLLAAIGKAESDHGQAPSPGIRSGANWAGAAGPMQIGIGGKATNTWGGTPRHPATQRTGGYGTDGNHDGWADVYDPADAIPAAARYLLAHGAPANMNQALYAYNPSTAYVQTVLNHARRYADTGPNPSEAADRNTSMSGSAECAGDVAAYTSLPGNTITKIIAYARAQLGKPYLWGGVGPDAFDCSGLTMMAYRAAGITIPRLTYDQWRHGARIAAGREQPGDLVFFRMGPRGPEHVALVYDTHRSLMIAAPHKGDVVRIQNYRLYPGGIVGFIRPSRSPL